MLRSYAARYSLIALGISFGFAVIYIVLDLNEAGTGITLANFLASFDLNTVFVLLAAVTFTVLAYMAGQQRDQIVAYAREREALNGVLRSLIHAPDPDLEQTLPRALQQMCRVLSMDAAACLTLDDGRWTAHAVTIQLPEALYALVSTQPWPPTLTPRPRVFDLSAASTAVQSEYRGSFLALVSAEAQPLGWLLLLSRQAGPLPPRTIDLVSTLSDQVGAALVRARQYVVMRRRARDLEAIMQTNRLLLAGLGLDELLGIIVNSAQVRFGLPYVSVLWVDAAAGEFYLRAQAGPLAAASFRQKLTEGLAGRVLRTGQPYLARDVRQEPDYIAKIDADIRSVLLTPLKTDERVIGVMTFQSLAVDAFNMEEALALTALTDQAAIAAENASLLIEAQRERQRVRAILHSTRDVVLLVDTAGRVQLLNPAAERLLGVSAPAVIGQPIELLLHLPAVLEAYQQHATEEQSFEAALPDDSTYLVTIAIAKDETGTGFGQVIIMRDITYLKRLDQFKSLMVQMASHDLRTPLGVALGYLDVLNEDLKPFTPFRKRALEGLEAALNRMQTLVVELLDLERVESGFDRLRVQLDVGRVVAEAVSEFEEAAQSRQQQLELTASPNLPPVMGDPARLKQAIGNLVNNALKYTPDGGCIRVRVQPDGQCILIEVQDSGYGIPPEAQAKLFQRFYRVRIPGAENITGTGLGLSLVKAVVEQHSGRVAAESVPGQGSTFRMWLPVTMSNDQ